MREEIKKKDVKEGNYVIYLEQVFEVVLNRFADELALDNNYGQLFLKDVVEKMFLATEEDWVDFCEGVFEGEIDDIT